MFFNYLFYRIFWWNIKIVKNDTYPYFASVIGVSFFQVLNLQFIIDMIGIIFFNKRWINETNSKILGFIVVSLFLLINFSIYQKTRSFNIINKKFVHWSKDKKRLFNLLCLIYIVFTMVSISYISYFIKKRF